jgi:hypothetical protein
MDALAAGHDAAVQMIDTSGDLRGIRRRHGQHDRDADA